MGVKKLLIRIPFKEEIKIDTQQNSQIKFSLPLDEKRIKIFRISAVVILVAIILFFTYKIFTPNNALKSPTPQTNTKSAAKPQPTPIPTPKPTLPPISSTTDLSAEIEKATPTDFSQDYKSLRDQVSNF